MKIWHEVQGAREVQDAFETVANFDLEQAGTNAALAVLPDVRRFTRINSGYLRSSWDAESSNFINDAGYAVYQEFGTVEIDPTHAVYDAWEMNEEKVKEAFEREIDRAIAQT